MGVGGQTNWMLLWTTCHEAMAVRLLSELGYISMYFMFQRAVYQQEEEEEAGSRAFPQLPSVSPFTSHGGSSGVIAPICKRFKRRCTCCISGSCHSGLEVLLIWGMLETSSQPLPPEDEAGTTAKLLLPSPASGFWPGCYAWVRSTWHLQNGSAGRLRKD